MHYRELLLIVSLTLSCESASSSGESTRAETPSGDGCPEGFARDAIGACMDISPPGECPQFVENRTRIGSGEIPLPTPFGSAAP